MYLVKEGGGAGWRRLTIWVLRVFGNFSLLFSRYLFTRHWGLFREFGNCQDTAPRNGNSRGGTAGPGDEAGCGEKQVQR